MSSIPANQILKDLQQKIDESMDSIQAIQGDQFRDMLAFIMGCGQVMRLLAVCVQGDDDNMLLDAAAKQAAKMFSEGSSMLAEAYKLEETQMEELMKWVETLDGHLYHALREASKNDN